MSSPRVSIGIPVYNGERFFVEVLESILSQSYTDFEVIISDNASTDNTEAICRKYQKKDHRVIYTRNSKNRGAAWNYNNVVKQARGEYFKWAAHDDLYHPDFLLQCITVLDQNPSAVLCFPFIADIDNDGNFLRRNDHSLDTQSHRPYRRFQQLLFRYHTCLQIFGLIRKDSLLKTNLIRSYAGSDRALIADLSVLGQFIEIPFVLFYHREHLNRSTRANPNRESFSEWFDPANKEKLNLPHWQLMLDYFSSSLRNSLTPKQRLACFLFTTLWALKNFKLVYYDFIYASKKMWIKLKKRKVVGQG